MFGQQTNAITFLLTFYYNYYDKGKVWVIKLKFYFSLLNVPSIQPYPYPPSSPRPFTPSVPLSCNDPLPTLIDPFCHYQVAKI